MDIEKMLIPGAIMNGHPIYKTMDWFNDYLLDIYPRPMEVANMWFSGGDKLWELNLFRLGERRLATGTIETKMVDTYSVVNNWFNRPLTDDLEDGPYSDKYSFRDGLKTLQEQWNMNPDVLCFVWQDDFSHLIQLPDVSDETITDLLLSWQE